MRILPTRCPSAARYCSEATRSLPNRVCALLIRLAALDLAVVETIGAVLRIRGARRPLLARDAVVEAPEVAAVLARAVRLVLGRGP